MSHTLTNTNIGSHLGTKLMQVGYLREPSLETPGSTSRYRLATNNIRVTKKACCAVYPFNSKETQVSTRRDKTTKKHSFFQEAYGVVRGSRNKS